MKRVTKILFIFFTFLLISPLNTKAFYCNYKVSSDLKKMAANINISYDYVINSDEAIFKITISNVYKNLIIKDIKNDKLYYPDKSKDMSEFVIDGFKGGSAYKFEVYTDVEFCTDKALYTIYTSPPKYNPYYNLDICKGYESYKLCQKWENHGLNKENFIKSMENYIESLKKEEPKEEPKINETINWILEFYLNYYYYILPVIIIISLGVIINNRKKDTFKF